MQKLTGFLLIVLGVILIFISIMTLVRAFDVFSNLEASSENIGYTFGSILFPLLLSVIGRWIFRKGRALQKRDKPV
jgi:multisubunit Na+/H+ antiporter MnhG subunit